MALTFMTLVGQALSEAGVKIIDGKFVSPSASNVAPAIAALSESLNGVIEQTKTENSQKIDSVVGGASEDYNNLLKVETVLKNLTNAMSTDTERLAAVNELVAAFEGADDFITGLVNGKLGKDDSAVNSGKLGGKTLEEVVEQAVGAFNTGTKADFVSALTEA